MSEAFCDAHPQVPWRKIIAQRHILAHQYGDIEHERLWRVVETHVPELVRLLAPLIPSPPDTSASDT